MLAVFEQRHDEVLVGSLQEFNSHFVTLNLVRVDEPEQRGDCFWGEVEDFDSASLALLGRVVAKHGFEDFGPCAEEDTMNLELLLTTNLKLYFSKKFETKQQNEHPALGSENVLGRVIFFTASTSLEGTMN